MKHIMFIAFQIIYFQISYAQILEFDLRDDINTGKNWVGFAVRDNTASGHAFVILGKENSRRMVTEVNIQGFYPSGNVINSPGEVKEDFISLRHIKNADQIFFIVNDNDYNTADQLLNTWKKSPPQYKLFTNNCIDLVQNVCKVIGVELPSRGPLSFKPKGYLAKVKEQARSNEGLNYYKTNSKIKNFNEGSFRGTLSGGKPTGNGILVSKKYIYKGEFRNGVPEGEGEIITKVSRYVGHLKNGIPNGSGKLLTKEKNFTGTFKDGKINGKGQIKNLSTGAVLESTFLNGKIEGKVTVREANGSEISSYDVKNGKQISPTETIYKNGSKKVTEFESNGFTKRIKYNGVDGTTFTINYKDSKPFTAQYHFPNGTEIDIQKYHQNAIDSAYGTIKNVNYTYVGDIKSLQFSGIGELNMPKVQMRGGWVNGRLQGANEYIHRDEFTFSGAIWYDESHSYQKGAMTYANGDTYNGSLRDYLLHGWGTYVHDEHCGGWGNCNSYTVTDNFVDNKSTYRPMYVPPTASFPDASIFKVPLSDFGPVNKPLPPILGIPSEIPSWIPDVGFIFTIQLLNPLP